MPEPTPEAWAQIRHDYEHTDRPLAHICAEHDITIPMMRYRMKKWDWTRRKPLIPRSGPPAVAMMQHEIAPSFHPTPPPAGEGEDIVPRLQSAVARVLPAIEATIARLSAGPHHPREMEQAGRTLSSLTRTLRELNTLLAEHNARPAGTCDCMPEDMDAYRLELTERIRVFLESRAAEKARQSLEGDAGRWTAGPGHDRQGAS